MKIKKTLFSILIVIGIGAVATTTITSCSGVSSTIMNNMVIIGDKFADGVDLDSEIKTALTDKSATDAFKKSVVNKVLTNWYKRLAGKVDGVPAVGSFGTDYDKFTKDIDTDYKNQIKSSKDAHKGNWQYYFQNEVLNPVGGTEAAWKENQLESKIRSYFTDKFAAQNYLAVPSIPSSKSGLDNKKMDLDINTSVYTGPGHLGTAAMTVSSAADEKPLNPDWWPMINFYATANPSFANATDRSKFQDETYALVQREAFDEYTSNVGPVSTSMALWKCTLPHNENNLNNIYNAKVIGGKASSSANGDNPTPGATLGYTFPYFGNPGDTSTGPNDKFNSFFTDFQSTTTPFFLNDRGDYTRDLVQTNNPNAGALGLSTIPYSLQKYTDDKSDMFLASRFNIAGDGGAFPTYTAELLNLFNHGMTAGTMDNTMPKIKASEIKSVTSDNNKHGDIMQNFLFANPIDAVHNTGDANPDVQNLPAGFFTGTPGDPDFTLAPGVLDLSNIYEMSGSATAASNVEHVRLFANKNDGAAQDSPWYAQNARYVVSAIQLQDNNSTPHLLPYIMTRISSSDANGVHVEGIDGYAYLDQTPNDYTYGVWKANWRPGSAWSQDRENALLKYRTAYENALATTNTDPDYGTPLGIISKKPSDSKATGAMIDYLNANTDSIILNAVDRVMDPSNPNYDSTYQSADIFGLKGFSNEVDWSTALNTLVVAFDALNKFDAIVAKYDVVDKALFAWGDTYRTNELLGNFKDTSANNKLKYDAPYSNGLAQALPVKLTSGEAATTGQPVDVTGNFRQDMHSHYNVVYETMDALALANIKSTTTPYNSIGDISYTQLTENIIDAYNAWSNYNVTRDTKRYAYNYSENILTNNQYVNDLLWAFGSSNNFSNSVKTQALNTYIGGDNIASTYSDAIASMYISTQLMGGSNPLLTSYQNTNYDSGGAADNSIDNYSNLLQNEWKYSLTIDRGANGVNGMTTNGVATGYTDKAITYDTLLASIKYLTAKTKDTDNKTAYQRFVEWLNQKIGDASWSNNLGYLVWTTENDGGADSSFYAPDKTTSGSINLTDTEATSLYGWHANYDGMFENKYQNTNSDAVANPVPGKTYASFDKYWQFAPMPLSSPATSSMMMGFMGLQTQASNSLSSTVKTALFDNYNASCDTVSASTDLQRTGSLYAYAVTEDGIGGAPRAVSPVQSRAKLVEYAKTLTTPSTILALATYIQNRTGQFGDIIDEINHETNPTEQRDKILIPAINNSDILHDNFFYGYNKNNKTTGITPTLELYNKANHSYNFYDEGKTTGPSSRVRVMQINKNDITVGDDKDYSRVYDNLATQLGPYMMKYLIVQAAMDTSVQSNMISYVIQNFLNGKIFVYDRRFNDQLGSSWVKDWKTKN